MEIHEIARWSAWPSLLCYSLAIGLWIGPRPGDWRAWPRRFWLAGWVLLVLHIAIAMGGVHHWSLEEAMHHTAMQTQAAVGWNWGGGVWLNFGTVAVWGWTLRSLKTDSQRFAGLNAAAHFYLAFMMFNATVVFGSHAAQLAGTIICIGLIARYLTPEKPR